LSYVNEEVRKGLQHIEKIRSISMSSQIEVIKEEAKNVSPFNQKEDS